MLQNRQAVYTRTQQGGRPGPAKSEQRNLFRGSRKPAKYFVDSGSPAHEDEGQRTRAVQRMLSYPMAFLSTFGQAALSAHNIPSR